MQKIPPTQEDIVGLARMLRKVELLSPLTVGEIDQILPYVLIYSYQAGETVFKQGAPGDAFYIVKKGKVLIQVKRGWFGFSKTASTLEAGDFFGEIALVSRRPRTATVRCIEPTELFTLAAVDFDFILKRNLAALREMDRIAERRRTDSRHILGS